MRLFRLNTSHQEYKFLNAEMFTICLVRQNDRWPEITFSGHQTAENELNETLNKKYRTHNSLKIWI